MSISDDDVVTALRALVTGSVVPCVARPGTDYRHPEGACRCFTGGPAPVLLSRPLLGVPAPRHG